MNRIQVIAKNVNQEQYSSPTAPCEKAVHRASHFPVGAKNILLNVIKWSALPSGLLNRKYHSQNGVEQLDTGKCFKNTFLALLKVVLLLSIPSEHHKKLLSLQIGSNLAEFWNYEFLIGLVSDQKLKSNLLYNCILCILGSWNLNISCVT